MSFWRKKIKFRVSGIDALGIGAPGIGACKGESGRINFRAIFFSVGTFYVIGIACAAALVFFAPYGKVEHYGAFNILPNKAADSAASSEKQEDYEFTDVQRVNFKLEDSVTAVTVGTESAEIARLKFFSAEDTLRLREVNLATSGIEDAYVSSVSLNDGDGNVYKGSLDNGYIVFKNLYLKVEPGEPMYFGLNAEFTGDLHFGQRFCVWAASPEAFDLTAGGEEVFIEKDYPVDGPCVSVVGKRVVF